MSTKSCDLVMFYTIYPPNPLLNQNLAIRVVVKTTLSATL